MRATQYPTAQPFTQRELSNLNDGELSIWLRRAQFRWVRSRRLSGERWQWRRASLRAMPEFGARARRHAGAGRTLYDRCQRRAPTTHWAFGEGDALRFGHFCEVCRRVEVPGWFGTSTTRGRSASRPAS